jgi:cytochrome c oxidase cbb3-type subunit 2
MYRLNPAWQVALVKNQAGHVDYHYQALVPNGKGPMIPWLNEQQREQFLAEGVVEEIAAPVSVVVADPPAEPTADSSDHLVAQCIAKLDEIRDDTGQPVPSSAGRPTCEKALRGAGFAFSNEVISAAVKQRKYRTNEEKQGVH